MTYDWDTDTLFVVGDGGTSVVQVSKTGALIDSMTLAPGGSPQGTEFYDTEGITYVGGGKFVLTEERDRQVNLFTYVAGATLTARRRADRQARHHHRQHRARGRHLRPARRSGLHLRQGEGARGIFQTGIDFAAGTATNGSPTTDELHRPVRPGAGRTRRLLRRLRAVEPAVPRRRRREPTC